MSRQLQPVTLVAPGSLGVNRAEGATLLQPEFATIANNAVIDENGRLAARSGWNRQTTTAITGNPAIRSIFEYRKGDGTVENIVSWNNDIANDLADPEGNSIQGTFANGSERVWFQNFNDKLLAFRDAYANIGVYTSGSFALVTPASGTIPTSHRGIALAAFGRVWMLDSDGNTIKYSAILDETNWIAASGAGQIDMADVWTDGTDEVTAIAAFNKRLVVFGNRHIVLITDGNDSTSLGLVTSAIYVEDVITGTGCVSQWTLQSVGESDLLFVSKNGVQSLRRTIQNDGSNPLANQTKTVRTAFLQDLSNESDYDEISTTYNPQYGFYLVTFPGNKTYCLDQRFFYRDRVGDLVNVVTEWPDLAPQSLYTREDFSLLIGNNTGIGQYGIIGGDDDGGDNEDSIPFLWESSWLDLGDGFEDLIKILKEYELLVRLQSNVTVTFKWAFDFDDRFSTASLDIEAEGSAEYNSGEYNTAEYAGGTRIRLISVPGDGRGQYIKVGIQSDLKGILSIQTAKLITKIGQRLA